MNSESVRDIVVRLSHESLVLAAAAAALQAKRTGIPLKPPLGGTVQQALAAAGLADLSSLSDAEAENTMHEIVITLMQATRLASAPAGRPEWDYADPDLLMHQGDTSALFPMVLKNNVLRLMDDLDTRLAQPGACFLDVGVGVGSLALAMHRLWPNLTIVGLDPYQPSLDIAARRIAEAGLDGSILLRKQRVQDIDDEQAFDLAWFSGPFLTDDQVPGALTALLRGLRPGGWVLFGTLNPGPSALSSAAADLRTVLWGGDPRSPDGCATSLITAGFDKVQSVPVPASALGALLIAQRPR